MSTWSKWVLWQQSACLCHPTHSGTYQHLLPLIQSTFTEIHTHTHTHISFPLFSHSACRWTRIRIQKQRNHLHWTMWRVWCILGLHSKMPYFRVPNAPKTCSYQIGTWLKSVPIQQKAANCYKTTVYAHRSWIHHYTKCQPLRSIM